MAGKTTPHTPPPPNTGAMATSNQQRPMTEMQRVAQAQKQKVMELSTLITSRSAAFAAVAGKHFNADRLVKLAHGVLSRMPQLADCTAPSMLVALMRCAELNLEPDSALPQRRMWLVPRKNGNTGQREVTYIIDYRAQIQLARETGLVSSVIAVEIRANDDFFMDYDPEGSSISKFRFRPGGKLEGKTAGPFGDRGDIVGYFTAARLEGGEVQMYAMSKKDAEAFKEKHAPKSSGRVIGPWVEHFDAMALKTCLRRLWNLLPAGKSDEARKLQEQLEHERQIEEGKSVVATAPVEMDLGMSEALVAAGETTEGEVERKLLGDNGGPAPAAKEEPKEEAPKDDVTFETKEEEAARLAAEGKAAP